MHMCIYMKNRVKIWAQTWYRDYLSTWISHRIFDSYHMWDSSLNVQDSPVYCSTYSIPDHPYTLNSKKTPLPLWELKKYSLTSKTPYWKWEFLENLVKCLLNASAFQIPGNVGIAMDRWAEGWNYLGIYEVEIHQCIKIISWL